jgi:hypothetical protein
MYAQIDGRYALMCQWIGMSYCEWSAEPWNPGNKLNWI